MVRSSQASTPTQRCTPFSPESFVDDVGSSLNTKVSQPVHNVYIFFYASLATVRPYATRIIADYSSMRSFQVNIKGTEIDRIGGRISADGTTTCKCFFISFGNYMSTLAHRTQLRVGWKVASFVDEDGVSSVTITDCFEDVRGHIFVIGIVLWVVGNDERIMSAFH